MALRVCMVTPFAWSQPHPVNEHVAGAAGELRRRGHEVVVLAPSNRAADLAAGRRALRRLARDGTPLPDLVALGPAVPVSGRSLVGVPLGVRANLSLALSADRFDVVHAHEPGLPSLSYLALRQARGLTVATFHSPERLGYPPSKRQREKLLARVDALTATSDAGARGRPRALPRRFPAPAARDRRDALRRRTAPGSGSCSSGAAANAPGPQRRSRRSRASPAGSSSSCAPARSPRRPYVPRSLRPRVRRAQGARRGLARRGAAGRGRLRPGAQRQPRRGRGRAGRRAGRRPARRGRPAGARDRCARPPRRGRCLAREGSRAGPARSRAREPREARHGARARRLRAGGRAAPAAVGRGSARRPAADRLRPAHAHGALARLLRSGAATCSTTPRRRSWARSRSPTTTSSPARRRRSSSRRAAT